MAIPDEIDVAELEPGPHGDEPHMRGGLNNQLNWLRAAVLGANDGIVSTAGIVMGVAGATSDRGTILVAGVAGLAAGALSMGAGEYVSVSTQKDSELALLEKERRELRDEPAEELEELAGLYVDKGLTEELALEVAKQLTEHDALGAHAETELGIDPDDIGLSGLEAGPHDGEPHQGGLNNRLNWLRAGVLGANDGIVSTAGIVMGVAGATSDRGTLMVAGVAGLAAGALSMAAG